MAKGKKAKKSKEKKDQIVPQVTTLPILKGRANVLCPRLGDAIVLTNKVTQILEETAQLVIQRASLKQSTTVNLSGHKLYKLGIESEYIPGLRSITSMNLSKNNLFDSAELFNVSYSVNIRKIHHNSLSDLGTVTLPYAFESLRELLEWLFGFFCWETRVYSRYQPRFESDHRFAIVDRSVGGYPKFLNRFQFYLRTPQRMHRMDFTGKFEYPW